MKLKGHPIMPNQTGNDAAHQSLLRVCPICGKSAAPRLKPFCSKRCADIDLGKWFNEAYRIPGEPAFGADTESDEPNG